MTPSTHPMGYGTLRQKRHYSLGNHPLGRMKMSKTEHGRAVRVAERIRGELTAVLMGGGVRDPAVSGAIVSAVRLSDDLRIARVYLRLLTTEPSDREKTALVRGMKRASGYLRRELTSRIQLKYSPELKFFWDEATDRGSRIEQVLSEIREDEDGAGSSE